MIGILFASCFPSIGTQSVGIPLKSGTPNSFYVNQAAPLSHSPLQKLPPGAVRARGWLKVELDLQTTGFAGNLEQISRFLDPRDNAWRGTGNSSRGGWEEVPYWLRGQVSLAYVTGNPQLISAVKKWIEPVLKGQQSDGWFGPVGNRDTKFGTPDLWPNMLMQTALQTYYEATGDRRVIELMSRYAKYLDNLPPEKLVDPRHYWHFHRVGDQLASLVWLYNRTKDPMLLKLAAKIHRAGSRWDVGIANHHGVNFAQGFREPATYSLFSGSASDWEATERDLKSFRDEFGQWPGGMYAADENARKGKSDPRQGTESCSIAEMMFSNELLLQFSGNPKWADEAENIAFNWMPATTTPDLKALRYLQSANLAVSDAPSKSPGVENGGPMFLMDPNDHRCCQHNIGMAWPYLTEHSWFSTDGDGLAAALYAPCRVTAKVSGSKQITIDEETDYPFSDKIWFHFRGAAKFPLSLRIPAWCGAAKVKINGKPVKATLQPGSFATLNRSWNVGDVVELSLPMEVIKHSWTSRPGAVSISRGPLWYSLYIAENYRALPRPNGWNAYEILPETRWNFGLNENTKVRVQTKAVTRSAQLFSLSSVPVSLFVKGREIPEWTLDMYGLAAPLGQSPAFSTRPVEELRLVPMGAARLRITVFPTVTTEPSGHKWKPSPQPKPAIPTEFSFRCWWDSERALSDGLLPTSSNDKDVPRFTWWDHKGTTEWVQYNFTAVKTFHMSRVYWFDDEGEGGCRTPQSWDVEVKVSNKWERVQVVKGPTIVKNGWSEIQFQPIACKQIRLVAKLKPGFSGGILEWETN